MQWRVLHGIIPVNSFLSVLNPEVTPKCPFCSERETVFHAFLKCVRLGPLFLVLSGLFSCCEEFFSTEVFILGVKYSRNKKYICQLLNFLLGEAKLAIYSSRKNEIEKKSCQSVTQCFFALVKSRVLIDFVFIKLWKIFLPLR